MNGERMMRILKRVRTYFLLSPLIFALCWGIVLAQANSSGAKPGSQRPGAGRDGQHDFDFNIGTWKTHVSRLLHPLTGSDVWGQYDGTTVVRKVWNGRANLAELEA